jgi:hypothetical protein
MADERHNNWGCDWDIKSLRKRFWNGQRQAHAAVAQAIKSGDLAPAKNFICMAEGCESMATDYDHADYSNPLDVVPVCRSCNLRWGRALPKRWEPQEAAKLARKQIMNCCNWKMATNPDLTVNGHKEKHSHNFALAKKTAIAHWLASRQAFRLRDAAHELFPEKVAMEFEAYAVDEILECNKWLTRAPHKTK